MRAGASVQMALPPVFLSVIASPRTGPDSSSSGSSGGQRSSDAIFNFGDVWSRAVSLGGSSSEEKGGGGGGGGGIEIPIMGDAIAVHDGAEPRDGATRSLSAEQRSHARRLSLACAMAIRQGMSAIYPEVGR